jgi:tetratricopeptide (TPR) repeat protein
MATTGVWKARPVFVSSTFRDMHAERDYLRHRVFPALEERLRERRCHLLPIDLRLGVETVELEGEEAKELQVLKVCLDEIERSRPFLIVLLGDRYGWVPPEARLAAAAQEAGFATDTAGKSVTALEIEFAILKKDPAQRSRCLFFFRDPLPYDRMPPEVAARFNDAGSPIAAFRDDHRKLVALKALLAADPELAPRVHRYRADWDEAQSRVTGLKGFGDMVLRLLWAELDAETHHHARQAGQTREDRERDALAEFVEHRGRDFIGREDIASDLLALVHSPNGPGRDWAACVTGPPGSGKSALFAHLYHRLEADPDVLLLAHAAGIGGRAAQVDGMLRRWIRELAAFLRIEDPLPEGVTAEDVDRTFASLLSRASAGRRVVALIDALDQFGPNPRAEYLTWLPGSWPGNARLIATTLPSQPAGRLGDRAGVATTGLSPLSEVEAVAIVRSVCARYHRTPNAEVIQALIARRRSDGAIAAGNPLWLTLAVEQMNLLDEDDFARADRLYPGTPEQRLHRMVLDWLGQLPPDVEDLYGWLLDQAEKVHGAPVACAVACLIALSRSGWRESDLRALVPVAAGVLFPRRPLGAWDDLKLAAVRRSFRAHVIKRGPQQQWDFFHLQMRRALGRRDLGDPSLARRLHTAIADHLESLSSGDALHQSEMMVHLIGADGAKRAVLYYAGPRTDSELEGATESLADHVHAGADRDPNPALDWVAAMLSRAQADPAVLAVLCERFLFELHKALRRRSAHLTTREKILRALEQALAALVGREPGNNESRWCHSVALLELGDIHMERGDRAGAEQSYLGAQAIAERLLGSDHLSDRWLHYRALVYDKLGQLLRAHGDTVGAERAFREVHNVAAFRARSMGTAETEYGLASSRIRMGDAMQLRGDLDDAEKEYRLAQGILERLAAADPSNTVWAHDLATGRQRQAEILHNSGDLDGAERAYREAHSIFERLAAADPSDLERQHSLGRSYGSLNFLLRDRSDSVEAERAGRAALEILERLVATDPNNAGWAYDLAVSHRGLGVLLEDRGEMDGAELAYRRMHTILDGLSAAEPTNAGWAYDLAVSHRGLGRLLRERGDLDGAERAHRAALAISDELGASEPDDAVRQHERAAGLVEIGKILHLRGDLDGSVAAYQEVISMLFELVHASRPENPDWHLELGTAQKELAEVLRDKGDLAGARKTLHSAAVNFWSLDDSNPGQIYYRCARAVCLQRKGSLELKLGDLDGASRAYHEELSVVRGLVEIEPENPEWPIALTDTYRRLGDLGVAMGDPGSAGPAYEAMLQLIERLSAAAPDDLELRETLSGCYYRMAIVTARPDSREWCRRAHEALASIEQAGQRLTPKQQDELRRYAQKAGL